MLFVPAGANNFGNVQESHTGQPTVNFGQTVTPAVGSKGSWVQVIASLTHDTYGLMININSNTASAASRNSVLDVGIGAASSEVVIIPDLICGNATTYNAGGISYYFPYALPAGARIAVRAQGTVTTAFRCFIQAMQLPMNPSMIKKASVVEAIGMTVPQGTSVVPGTTSDGAWVLLGTASRRLWHWQIGAQVISADTSHGTNGYHIDMAVGDGTNFNFILKSARFYTTTAEAASNPAVTLGSEYPVVAGQSLYARARGNAQDTLYLTAYGAGG